MYIQCQSSNKELSNLGNCTGHIKAYANDEEARESFFKSLIEETDFYADEEKKCKLRILTVKRAGAKGSPYLEFTAIGDFYGESNVPIIGLIAFQVKNPKFKIIK